MHLTTLPMGRPKTESTPPSNPNQMMGRSMRWMGGKLWDGFKINEKVHLMLLPHPSHQPPSMSYLSHRGLVKDLPKWNHLSKRRSHLIINYKIDKISYYKWNFLLLFLPFSTNPSITSSPISFQYTLVMSISTPTLPIIIMYEIDGWCVGIWDELNLISNIKSQISIFNLINLISISNLNIQSQSQPHHPFSYF